MVLNGLIWAAFAVELVTMLIVVPDRWHYLVRHPMDVLIVLVTAPLMPATWQAARVVRLLRVARIYRVFSLRRVISLEGVKYAALIVGLIVILGGALFAAVEGRGLTTWDGVWWAMTTVTTVGYGEIYPHTDGGRAIANRSHDRRDRLRRDPDGLRRRAVRSGGGGPQRSRGARSRGAPSDRGTARSIGVERSRDSTRPSVQASAEGLADRTWPKRPGPS